MWLIEKGGDGRSGSRIPLPSTLEEALTRWYIGAGNAADERAGITLVQQARIGAKWLACSCLGAEKSPPVLTPAYLSEAETYYLRRLTGQKRPGHRTECPFFRDQATSRVSEVRDRQLPADSPDGYFEVIRPAPEKLAQQPDGAAVDDRTRHASFPKLALLLRRLLEAGGLGHWDPRAEHQVNAIGKQFARLRSVAARIEVAPGLELGRVLWTHSDALHSRRIYAGLRKLEGRWPRSHAPQGFLLTFAREFHGHIVHPADGEPFRVANRIQSPAVRSWPFDGPFLILTVIGTYPEARGYAPLRAYAQPILSGRAFIAVESNTERDIVRTLMDVCSQLDRRSVGASIEKPLFDQLSPLGSCRPDVVLELTLPITGEIKRIGILLSDADDPLPDATIDAVRALMPTIVVDAGSLDRVALLRAVEQVLETAYRQSSDNPNRTTIASVAGAEHR